MGVLILLGVGVVAGIAAYVSYYVKKKRREGFLVAASQLGLDYAVWDLFSTAQEPFKLFQKGDGRGVENVIYGTWQGLDVREFDYWYYDETTDGQGHRSKTYHRFSCVIAPVEAGCSPVTIEHENMLTRLANHLAMHDIELESEDFNREFNVRSIDKKFANDLLDARMMQWLLEHGAGYSFEVVADEALVFCHRLQPMEIVPLIGTARQFCEHIPRVVYSLYPKNPAPQTG